LHQPNVSEQDIENHAALSLSATGSHQDQNFDKDNPISDEYDPNESDPSSDEYDPDESDPSSDESDPSSDEDDPDESDPSSDEDDPDESGPRSNEDDPCLDKNLKISPKNVSIINVEGFNVNVSWNPKEDSLAMVLKNKEYQVDIWIVEKNELNNKFQVKNYDKVFQCKLQLKENDYVTKPRWSNDGSLLAIGTKKGVVYIWNIKEDKEEMKFEIEGSIVKIKWNPNGRYIYASSYQSCCIRDLKSNENVFEKKFLNYENISFVWQTNEDFAYQQFSFERRNYNFFLASYKINENTAFSRLIQDK